MNPACAKCNKTVYPMEKLNCLDKYWHKACFKCAECNMTLNMKNYKGYNKSPYCNAHYPTTKFTAVADTPENLRLSANTKNQSAAIYHKDFEKSRGKFTAIADDPETMRIRKNMDTISQKVYTTELTSTNPVTKPPSPLPSPLPSSEQDVAPSRDDEQERGDQETDEVSYQGVKEKKDQMEMSRPGEGAPPSSQHHHRPVGGQSVLPPQQQRQQQQNGGAAAYRQQQQQQATGGGGGRIGSIADYDPVNEQFGSIASGYTPRSQGQPGTGAGAATHYPAGGSTTHMPPPQQQIKSNAFRALYDYQAADSDEVSFQEGDLIVNCQSIDEGWMEGTVKRTSQAGMLPSNYVERAN